MGVYKRGICQNLHFDHRWYIFRSLTARGATNVTNNVAAANTAERTNATSSRKYNFMSGVNQSRDITNITDFEHSFLKDHIHSYDDITNFIQHQAKSPGGYSAKINGPASSLSNLINKKIPSLVRGGNSKGNSNQLDRKK